MHVPLMPNGRELIAGDKTEGGEAGGMPRWMYRRGLHMGESVWSSLQSRT